MRFLDGAERDDDQRCSNDCFTWFGLSLTMDSCRLEKEKQTNGQVRLSLWAAQPRSNHLKASLGVLLEIARESVRICKRTSHKDRSASVVVPPWAVNVMKSKRADLSNSKWERNCFPCPAVNRKNMNETSMYSETAQNDKTYVFSPTHRYVLIGNILPFVWFARCRRKR